ncbi:hypothetical protein IQ07DRAFT_645045 [Pyrenochaeta sp. DS3sAY3a]|nr:hypothetical protein IQ07DRAFT_645045 [Pyrenochaeta sp. DS3sAY3a]
MHFLKTILTLILLFITFVACAPTTAADLTSLNFPAGALNTLLQTSDDKLTCFKSSNCGVITYKNGTYKNFYEGICIPIGKGVESIYVAHCYCSIWSTCMGSRLTDEYVAGMIMCEMPRMANTFKKPARYISCGGRNT